VTAAVVPFDFRGNQVRTVDVHGAAWFFAADVCAALAIGNARDAVEPLDDDEKGVVTADTLGGRQQVSIVSEPGLYSLILRSRKPEAKAFKRWVTHEVLPAIRKTGRFDGLAVENIDRRTLAQWVIEEVNRREVAESHVAELEPRAAVADRLIAATGDYSVREAAQILCRDPAITTGERRLFAWLKQHGWIQDAHRAYQRQIDIGRVRLRTDTRFDPYTGEPHITSQIRITPKGLADLHQLLGGQSLALVPA
jgi:anti-repressor protein